MFDKEQFLKLVDQDMTLALEIIKIYISQWPQSISLIKRFLSEKDFTEAEKQAHKLKGSFKNFYCSIGVDCVQQLESACHQHELEQALETLIKVKIISKQLEDQLEISFGEK